jgi:hypothetical protein
MRSASPEIITTPEVVSAFRQARTTMFGILDELGLEAKLLGLAATSQEQMLEAWDGLV